MSLDQAVMAEAPNRNSALDQLSNPKLCRYVFYAAAVVLLAAAWGRNVNWDEFYFLSHIHAHLDGRLNRPMQTGYVHAFGWLAKVPGAEMGQIFVARLVMTACLAATCLSLFRIAAAMAGRAAAQVAVVAFLTSGFVIAYGASFRADPIAAATLMAAMALTMTSRMGLIQILAVAALIAASLLVTVKSVLYLPAFLGVMLWRWDDRAVVLRVVAAGCLGVVLAGALYHLHAAGIASAPGNDTPEAAQRAMKTTLLQTGLFPRAQEALLWAGLSVGALLLCALGLVSAGPVRRVLALFAFVSPLLVSVALYRNAFPYFFPFIVPPLMILAALGAARLGRGAALGALMALMLGTGAIQSAKALSEGAELQRQTLAEVHRLFPEPVPYIDQNAMVATFPRDLFFMSGLGLSHYRTAGRPVMAELIARTQPPLLLANREALHIAMHHPEVPEGPHSLLAEDSAALRASYVHHAGTLWLAGRDVTLTTGAQRVVLPFPGRYRVETAGTVYIDGQRHAGGAVIDSPGAHRLSGEDGQTVRLIWATPGEEDPSGLRMGLPYIGFWQLGG